MASSVYPVVLVNGVNLRRSDLRTSLHPDTPPRITNIPSITSVRVPGRDGSLRTPQGSYPSPLFTVTVNVGGLGSTLDARIADVDLLVAQLGQLVSTPVATIEYRRSASDILYADARITTFEEPAEVNRDELTVKLVFELFAPFWWGSASPVTYTGNVTSSSQTFQLGTDHSGTAPILDSVHLLTGPLVNPRITDTASGDWWQYSTTVSAGQKLRFDAVTLRATVGASVSFTVDGTAASALISVGGNGTLQPSAFRVTPGPLSAGADPSAWRPTIRVDSTGYTSASRWEVRARKAHR